MEWLQIITLALLQGITEFLPISSSAHLILPSRIWGWPDQGLAFDVAVHLGTLVAVLGYFREDLSGYVSSAIDHARFSRYDERLDEALKLAAATVPVVVAGFALKDWIETNLRSVTVIALSTIGFGLLLGFADRLRGTDTRVSWAQAGWIGAAQALALIPGTSRSGITITVALMLGLCRTAAARFSFLLAIPTIAGAALLMGADLLTSPEAVPWADLLAGFTISGVSAYLCIGAFVALVERTGMLPYVIYRLVLGAALLLFIG